MGKLMKSAITSVVWSKHGGLFRGAQNVWISKKDHACLSLKKIENLSKFSLATDLVQGPCVPKYEIDGALDVAVVEVVPADVVEQRVLRPQDPAPVQHGLVAGQPQRHRLLPDRPRRRRRRGVLPVAGYTQHIHVTGGSDRACTTTAASVQD